MQFTEDGSAPLDGQPDAKVSYKILADSKTGVVSLTIAREDADNWEGASFDITDAVKQAAACIASG